MNKVTQLPFITVGSFNDEEYVGIMGNMDSDFTSIYLLSEILDYQQQLRFLDAGEEWWWETNRLIPINISLKRKWDEFVPFMRTFSTQNFTIISGPIVSIDNLINTKIKRRKINLLKNKVSF